MLYGADVDLPMATGNFKVVTGNFRNARSVRSARYVRSFFRFSDNSIAAFDYNKHKTASNVSSPGLRELLSEKVRVCANERAD